MTTTAVTSADPPEDAVTSFAPMTRQSLTLLPDPRRVVVKLFVPGEDAPVVRTRAHALIDRIADLPAAEAADLLSRTVAQFERRHRDLEGIFLHHFGLVRHRVDRTADLSATQRLLVGAYFTHEFAVEAAALCNPSIVAHPVSGRQYRRAAGSLFRPFGKNGQVLKVRYAVSR